MMNTPKPLRAPKTVLLLSLLALFGTAQAQDDEDPQIKALKTPDSSMSVGIGNVSGSSADKAIYGQYNGQRTGDATLLLDVDIKQRDDKTGTWRQLQGRNLGQDNRELKASYELQGDWQMSLLLDALTHQDPRSLQSAAGTSSDAATKRTTLGLAAGKWITPRLLLQIDVKNQQKTGSRLSGQGLACGAYSSAYNVCGAASGVAALLASTTGAVLPMIEPVDSNIKQIEARLSYAGEHLKLNTGYYGSFYVNQLGAFSPGVPAALFNPDGSVIDGSASPGSSLLALLQQPFALPPDNQAHKWYVDGNYAFTHSTRATFKLARTHASQTRDFASQGLAGLPGSSNLGGAVDTTLSQLGLTARPTSKLSLLGNLRLEDKQDNTPVAVYGALAANTSGITAFSNNLYSSRKFDSKLEANYQLSANYRAALGLDYQTVQRSRPVVTALIDGLSGLREDTRELSWRAELRRSMSETINGVLSYSHKWRNGSSWFGLGAGFPELSDAQIYSVNGAFPFTLEDRQRQQLKLAADWTASEDLSLQFTLAGGSDRYQAPAARGLHDTAVHNYGVDALWKMSDKWSASAYWNQSKQTLHLSQTGYLAELGNTSQDLSLGLTGNLSATYQVGLRLSHMNDNNRYLQSLTSGAPLLGGGLPDVNYRLNRLSFFGKYTLDKNAAVRLDLMAQRATLDDWQWGSNGVAFAYSDHSQVLLQPNQNINYVGISYVYKLK